MAKTVHSTANHGEIPPGEAKQKLVTSPDSLVKHDKLSNIQHPSPVDQAHVYICSENLPGLLSMSLKTLGGGLLKKYCKNQRSSMRKGEG
jgi:hypothetical protein